MDPTATKGKEEPGGALCSSSSQAVWQLRLVRCRSGEKYVTDCGFLAAQRRLRGMQALLQRAKVGYTRLSSSVVRGLASCATLDLEMPLPWELGPLGGSAQAQRRAGRKRQCGVAALTRLTGWWLAGWHGWFVVTTATLVLGTTFYEQFLISLVFLVFLILSIIRVFLNSVEGR